jgi:hypothetical protein
VIVFVLVLTAMATALSGGLALASLTERQIASTHRRATQVGLAADMAAERVVHTLEVREDWRDVPGTANLGDTEGSPAVSVRTEALNRSLAARYPMGPDTPRWRVVDVRHDGVIETAVWVSDDPADRDGRPDEDSNGRVVVRAEAWTALGGTRAVEVYLARDEAVTRRLSWREVW